MADMLAAMREFRFLDDKRNGGNLSSGEESRWRELKRLLHGSVDDEPEQPQPPEPLWSAPPPSPAAVQPQAPQFIVDPHSGYATHWDPAQQVWTWGYFGPDGTMYPFPPDFEPQWAADPAYAAYVQQWYAAQGYAVPAPPPPSPIPGFEAYLGTTPQPVPQAAPSQEAPLLAADAIVEIPTRPEPIEGPGQFKAIAADDALVERILPEPVEPPLSPAASAPEDATGGWAAIEMGRPPAPAAMEEPSSPAAEAPPAQAATADLFGAAPSVAWSQEPQPSASDGSMFGAPLADLSSGAAAEFESAAAPAPRPETVPSPAVSSPPQPLETHPDPALSAEAMGIVPSAVGRFFGVASDGAELATQTGAASTPAQPTMDSAMPAAELAGQASELVPLADAWEFVRWQSPQQDVEQPTPAAEPAKPPESAAPALVATPPKTSDFGIDLEAPIALKPSEPDQAVALQPLPAARLVEEILLSEDEVCPPPAPAAGPAAQAALVVEGIPVADVEEPAPPPVSQPVPVATAAPAPAVHAPAQAEDDLPEAEIEAEEEAPPAAALAPLALGGEYRVVVHTVEGLVKRGTLRAPDLSAKSLQVEVLPGQPPELIPTARVKAIFFMVHADVPRPAQEGRKLRVTFTDGRQVSGFCTAEEPGAGFFMVPADTRTNTARIYVYRAAVRSVVPG